MTGRLFSAVPSLSTFSPVPIISRLSSFWRNVAHRAGAVVGLLGALALTRSMTSLLYKVGSTDVATLVAVPVVLAGVALAASYLPARRATRIDPLLALRHE